MTSSAISQPSRVKPPALLPGDTVGIIAPASAVDRDLLEKGCEGLSRMGYKPFYHPSIFEHDLYFAGSVERRARELEEMFECDEVRAIVCARGGYGCNTLLDMLDIGKIAAHPKIFVGYSDVTTLLTWFCDAANLVTFHGPMVNKDFGNPEGVEAASWQALERPGVAHLPAFFQYSGVRGMVDGFAEGILYGGCLSLLVASLGTPYEIKTAGTILFLEDINVKPYQVDRMLMQLKLAGKFEGVRGLIFGEMLECRQATGQPYSLEEVIEGIVGPLRVPVAFGFPSGHVARKNRTLPLGVQATMRVAGDTNQPLQLGYEPPVSNAPSHAAPPAT